MAATTLPSALTQEQLVAYVEQQAPLLGLDPAAVLAVASQEGLGGGIGDNGTSFGPWQLHIGGALPGWVGNAGSQFAQAWSWSSAGVDYALQQMAQNASGLSGSAAVTAIVTFFERPANVAKEVAGAIASLPIFIGGQATTTTTTTTTTSPSGSPTSSGSGSVTSTGQCEDLQVHYPVPGLTDSVWFSVPTTGWLRCGGWWKLLLTLLFAAIILAGGFLYFKGEFPVAAAAA